MSHVMSQNIIPLVLGGATAVSIGLYFGGSGSTASSAPKHNQLNRRNSDLAMSAEGAAMRRAAKAEGHGGKAILHNRTLSGGIPDIGSAHPSSLDEATREVTYWCVLTSARSSPAPSPLLCPNHLRAHVHTAATLHPQVCLAAWQRLAQPYDAPRVLLVTSPLGLLRQVRPPLRGRRRGVRRRAGGRGPDARLLPSDFCSLCVHLAHVQHAAMWNDLQCDCSVLS